MKAVLKDKIYISYSKYIHDLCKEKLTYRIEPANPLHPPELICTYAVLGKKFILLPIARTDLLPDDCEIIDKRTEVPVLFPKLNSDIILRDSQQEAVNLIKENYLINANPSWGKTFTGLAIARELGQKTLIVVHTSFLRDQWVEECKFMLDIIPGIVGGGKKEFDHNIVIGNVQTLTKLITSKKNTFGTVIFDECHHVPAATFRNIANKMTAKYKLGLSATIKRKDKKEILIYDYISTKVYKPKEENMLEPKILLINSGFKFPTGNTPWALKVTTLMRDSNYRSLIYTLAKTQAEKGHKVLVLSNRVDFLKYGANVTDNSESITGSDDSISRKDKLKKLREGKVSIIFGSDKIFSEGISEKAFSCLIIAFPLNNNVLLEQIVGRVCRPILNENNINIKKQPIILDIQLIGYTSKKQQSTRNNFYYENGWEVVTI